MELEEHIENTLRRKRLEEMMDRPKRVYTLLDGMDDKQIREFALFLYEENQKKSKQFDDMIARLDRIGKDLKEARKQLDSLSVQNKKAENILLEHQVMTREYKKFEKKYNDLLVRMILANAQTYASSKNQKGINKKKSTKGKHDDKDDFGSTPTKGDAHLKSLQSDGGNVYMYLDDELVNAEHFCCLAHARAKFKYAYEQGCEQARFFLEKMGMFYRLEESYR